MRASTSATPTSTDTEFKAIVEAYDLLRSPSRRSIYLRSGYGWTSAAARPPGATRGGGFAAGEAYNFSRGRPMPQGGYGARRGTYPSSAYDNWSDPYSPHFRPEESGGGPGSSSQSGWAGKGSVSSNGTLFLGLLGLTMVITPLSFYNLVPPSSLLPSNSRFADPEWGGLSTGRDSRHDEAARALTTARREARNGAEGKREALK